MIRLIRRSWKYLFALLGRRFEDAADPEIQIEQAIEEGKRQHALLVQQAAAVIGNQRELELRLGRSIDRVERLRSSAREALRLADGSRHEGDDHAVSSFEETAYLLWHGVLPTRAQLEEVSAQLRASRTLPDPVSEMMRLLDMATR